MSSSTSYCRGGRILSGHRISKPLYDLENERWLEKAFKFVQLNHEQGAPIPRDLVSHLVHRCTNQGDPELGRQLVSFIHFVPLLIDYLIRLFASCGSLVEANQAFNRAAEPSQYTWNAAFDAQTKHGEHEIAYQLYEKMQKHGGRGDKFTFLSMLKTCSTIEQGRYIHEDIAAGGLHDISIGNTLIHMYAKCGSLDEAFSLFSSLANRTVVSWNAMITGYATHGEGSLAIECFVNMVQQDSLVPDKFTFSSILKVCGSIGAIEQGRHVHEQLIGNGFQCDVVVGSSLVFMYAKCGSMVEAHQIFNQLPRQNVVSYTTMIAGYAQLGEAAFALQCFEGMRKIGVKPNDVSFLGILTACSRVGLVDEGIWYLRDMQGYPGIKMDIFHIASIVDLLGRAGCFQEAEDLLKDWRQSNIYLWMTLLNTCKMHCNKELGRRCFDKIFLLQMQSGEINCMSVMGTRLEINQEVYYWGQSLCIVNNKNKSTAFV